MNNAGILRDKSFHNMTPDLYDAVIDVHLRGAYYVTVAAWPLMREQGYGRVGGFARHRPPVFFGNFGQANYGAAKMGLVGFTNVLAVEGAKYNIKANSIAPLAMTRMTEDLLGGELGAALGPELISPLVTYLSSEGCDATGRVFSVGGGRVAEIFIGEAPGYMDTNLTPESLAANWDAVTNQEGYFVPNTVGDETMYYLEQIKKAAQ
ncbi:MAG: SDR family NAD(P)-dependent oxidoreductase [Acidimicrobiales bacterium]